MKNTLETRLGIFFALALIVAVIILELIGAADFFKKGYRIYASFDNVQELKKGDQIKLAGVEVGRVEKIALENGKAKVTMKIEKRFEDAIKTDSKAVVQFTGLMGQNFLAIEGGSPDAPKALPGSALETRNQPDLSVLMTKLEGVANGVEGLTKSFSPESFSTLLGPITDFMKQNSGQLSTVISNMKTISGNVAEGKGTVGKLINDREFYDAAYGAVTNFQVAAADLRGMMGKANDMIDQARTVITRVNEGQGTLGKLSTDETLYKETTTAMANLREILEKMNQGKGTFGSLINDDSFMKNAKLTLQKVEKATEGLEDQGPLSVLGIAVNPLF
jgi:phospholipid/cholesterol/gamma-HCH transport system substrate-binding protein